MIKEKSVLLRGHHIISDLVDQTLIESCSQAINWDFTNYWKVLATCKKNYSPDNFYGLLNFNFNQVQNQPTPTIGWVLNALASPNVKEYQSNARSDISEFKNLQ